MSRACRADRCGWPCSAASPSSSERSPSPRGEPPPAARRDRRDGGPGQGQHGRFRSGRPHGQGGPGDSGELWSTDTPYHGDGGGWHQFAIDGLPVPDRGARGPTDRGKYRSVVRERRGSMEMGSAGGAALPAPVAPVHAGVVAASEAALGCRVAGHARAEVGSRATGRRDRGRCHGTAGLLPGRTAGPHLRGHVTSTPTDS